MFALFYSLYYAMFVGSWYMFNTTQIATDVKAPLNMLGQLLTSIFNNVDTPITNLGNSLTTESWLSMVAFVLALITSIGIVVMAVKGVKKAFGIFFGHIR